MGKVQGIIAAIFYFLFSLNGHAQKSHELRADIISGVIAPHYSDMAVLRQSPVLGASLQYSYSPEALNVFDHSYKRPEYGLGIEFINLGNPEMLGSSSALYLHWGFHAIKNEKIRLKFWFAPGMAYVSKIYGIDNPENTAISNHNNIYFKLASSFAYSLNKNLSLTTTASITHYSNGATRYPNRGLNQLNISLGAAWIIQRIYDSTIPKSYPEKGFEGWLIGTAGRCDSYSTGINSSGVQFWCNTITLGAAYRYSFWGKAGISVDGIINRADHHYWDVNWDKILPVPDQTFMDYFRIGLCGGHEFSYKNFGFLTYAGFYVYSKIKPYDWSYFRTGFRYYVKPVVLNLTLKSVGFKAQYLEFGIGLYLNNYKKKA